MILIAEIDFAHQNCVSFLMPARLLYYCPVSAMAFRMHRFWTAAVQHRTAGKGSHCSAVKCFVRQEKVCIAPQWSCVLFREKAEFLLLQLLLMDMLVVILMVGSMTIWNADR